MHSFDVTNDSKLITAMKSNCIFDYSTIVLKTILVHLTLAACSQISTFFRATVLNFRTIFLNVVKK